MFLRSGLQIGLVPLPRSLGDSAAGYPCRMSFDVTEPVVGEDGACALASTVAERVPGARASIVFGSCARGTAVPGLSDVDLLVFVDDRASVGNVRWIAEEISDADVSVLLHDPSSLAALCSSDWSFAEHLSRESLPAFGDVDELSRRLAPKTPSTALIRKEIAAHLTVTEKLAVTQGLGGEHLHAYGRLYAAVKSASILDGVLASEISFDRREAISAAARRRPQLAEEFELIGGLEPFWLRLRRRASVGLPWRPRYDDARLGSHVAAAATVLRALSRPK
jgi:predicted nucleotidyltransferase